jgi:chorismate dehydratase
LLWENDSRSQSDRHPGPAFAPPVPVDWRVSRLRVAAIHFLNPAPLMWDFDHDPGRQRLSDHYQIESMTPSACAARLQSGAADLGLVPVAALAAVPGLRIAPGCAIASKGAIRSILLVAKGGADLASTRTVAADSSSRASLAYLQILFARFWKASPRYLQHPPDLEQMLAHADAALLIGDPALLALENRAAREARTGERLNYIDLGLVWRQWTGLPWVSAVWAIRGDAVNGNSALARRVASDLLDSRDAGLAHREDLVCEWAPRLGIPQTTIRTYLNDNIHYVLDEECRAGLECFFALAAECGALSSVPLLPML